MQPNFIERERGGWLAVTPSGDQPAIGVTAETKEAASAAYQESWSQWQRLLAAAKERAKRAV